MDAGSTERKNSVSGASAEGEEEEYFEREAAPLKHSSDEDEAPKQVQPSSKAQKAAAKEKKPRHRAVVLDHLEYANKPTGCSSSTRFVGDDDLDDWVPPYRPTQTKSTNTSVAASSQSQLRKANDDDVGNNKSSSLSTGGPPMTAYWMDEEINQYWDEITNNNSPSPGSAGGANFITPRVQQQQEQPAAVPPTTSYVPWSRDDGTTMTGEPQAPTTDPLVAAIDGYTADSKQDGRDDDQDDDDEQYQDVDAEEDAEDGKDEPITIIEKQQQLEEEEEQSVRVLEREVQRLKQDLLDTKSTLDSTKKAQRVQFEQLQSEIQELEESSGKLRSTYEAEKQKWAHDKKKFNDESEKRREKINALQKQANEKSDAYNSVLVQVEELRRQKEMLEKAVEDAANGPCGCDVNVNGIRQRALAAEVTLLKLKRQVEIRSLERACRDAEYIIAHLSSIIEKAAADDVPRMAAYRQNWRANLSKLDDNITLVEKYFEDQIRQIESGVPLASLDPIRLPEPPPAPRAPSKPAVNKPVVAPEASPPPLPPTTAAKIDNMTTMHQQQQREGIMTMDAAAGGGRSGSNSGSSAASPRPGSLTGAGGSSSSMAGGGSVVRSPAVTPSKIAQPTKAPPGFSETANIYPVVALGGAANSKKNEQQQQQAPVVGFRPIAGSCVSPPNPATVQRFGPPPAGFRPINNVPASAAVQPPQQQQHRITTTTPPTMQAASGGGTPRESVDKGAAENQPRTKLGSLIDTVLEGLPPHVARDSVVSGIGEYRESMPAKNLRGIPWDDLVAGLRAFMIRKYPLQPPMARPTTSHQQQDEDCFVCLEKLSSAKIMVMDCNHAAHEKCLQQWFAKQKSCPVCRSLALPMDEYPRLA